MDRIVQEFCEAFASPGTDRWHFVFDLTPEQLTDRAIGEGPGGWLANARTGHRGLLADAGRPSTSFPCWYLCWYGYHPLAIPIHGFQRLRQNGWMTGGVTNYPAGRRYFPPRSR